MAPHLSNMTRSSSTDSSVLSNILVATVEEDGFASDHDEVSTPPTSLEDDGSLRSGKTTTGSIDIAEGENLHLSGRRSKRVRSGPSTYNIKKSFDAQEAIGSTSSRNVSGLTGRTLVDDDEDDAFLGKKDLKATEMDWETSVPSKGKTPAKVQRRPSVKDKIKKAARKINSVLGKRKSPATEVEESPKQNKIMKELDMGRKGILDEMDLSDDEFNIPQPRPSKRAKLSEPVPIATQISKPTAVPLPITSGRRVKKWLKEGLYVGQEADMARTQNGGRKKLQKKSASLGFASSSTSAPTDTSAAPFMPLPMFGYLDKERDFIMPFDIYATTQKKELKVKDWNAPKNTKNRLVGDAKEVWKKKERLPSSLCDCKDPEDGELGCDERCMNRVMSYECDENNCNVGPELCSNRVFAELEARTRDSKRFDVGVEVVKTDNRGHGVRACRIFLPGQIIMEYTGEVITEGECQRRMHEEYKDKQCYYLMQLERGLVIDGTKGSMARFINHSCEPNCQVRMVKVNGTPRMAIFAGIKGIMTGEELTYDYNFSNFGAEQQKCYCGAGSCRGYLTKRLNKAEQAKQDRVDAERKRKAAEEAEMAAEAEARKKKVKTDRGSGWRGWLAVDDPETKAMLKAEKKMKEEAEKNSIRGQRAARRVTGLPAPTIEKAKPVVKKRDSKRRKTTGSLEQETVLLAPEEADDPTASAATITSMAEIITETTHQRAPSTGSRFLEEIERPASAQTHISTTTTVQKTEVTVSTTAAKGKEMMRSVGEAVRKSLMGIEKGTGGGKLKQSTLSFSRVE